MKNIQNQPKVSIIIPIYNVALWLEDCLNSVVNQTLRDIEIVCVNDASTDNSLEILKKFASNDSRIILINQENNQGLSVTRNVGVQHSTGAYLYFLDSDDMLRLDAMEELYQKASNEKLYVLCFDGSTFFESELLEKKFKFEEEWCIRSKLYEGIKTGREMFLEMFPNGDYKVVVWLLFFDRKFFINNHFQFIPGILFEDNIFTYEVFLKAQKVAHVRNSFYMRRVRETSITTSSCNFSKSYSFFVNVLHFVEIIKNYVLTYEETIYFHKEIDRLLKLARNEYKCSSSEEQIKYLSLPLEISKMYKYLVVDYMALEKEVLETKRTLSKFRTTEKELKSTRKKLNDIKSGWSFRIGRIITWLPRKLLGRK